LAHTAWALTYILWLPVLSSASASKTSSSAGNLYYVWYDPEYQQPYLATSTNGGLNWSKPLMIAPPGVREVQWPTVAAGAKGRIAITFPGTTVNDATDLTRPWNYVVTSTNALAA